MKFKQEIFIFILLVFFIFSISVVSATESLDDTSTDELVLLSNNNELVDTMDVNVDKVQDDDSADLNDTAETDESENGQNQKNILSASNNGETLLGLVQEIHMNGSEYITNYGYTFEAIQQAVNNLASGGKLFLDGGHYNQTGTSHIDISRSIILYGGTSEDDTNSATLDAQGKSRAIFSHGSIDHYFYNLKIIDGYANTPISLPAESIFKNDIIYPFASLHHGGGMLLRVNSVHLSNIIVDNCSYGIYSGFGAGIAILAMNTVTIENCNFTNNHGCSGGTGLRVTATHGGQIINCSFINNYNFGDVKNAGAGLQVFSWNLNKNITISNCYFKDNSILNIDPDKVSNENHGGALCMLSPNVICESSTFINNTCSQGGAITLHTNGTVFNCTFINNTAIGKYGGAISTGLDTADITVNIVNCTFEGNQAPIGGAVQLKGNDIHITNCSFDNNSAIQGGACYIQGQRAIIENSNFTGNNATHNLRSEVRPNSTVNGYSNEGGAIYIGKISSSVTSDNAKILNSNFNSNNATNGAGIYITGQSATIQDNNFDNNTATEGAGVYIKGNSAQISDNNFTGNNVSGKGGAVYIEGDYSKFTSNNFNNNTAREIEGNEGVGLGGAIYVTGNYTNTFGNTFTHNKARNGSAIYTDGVNFTLENDKFNENQAESYLLITTAQPPESYYNEKKINVTVVHIGGDNILNAIYNKKSNTDIYLKNVTYAHSKHGNITSPDDDFYNPVNGATRNTTLYQDDREDYQLINLTITNNADNNVEYHNSTLYTDIYGNVTLIFNEGYFKKGVYTVFAEHPEDWNYQYIKNTATFTINYSLTDNKTVSNQTPYYGTEVDFNLTIYNDAEIVYNDNINSKG